MKAKQLPDLVANAATSPKVVARVAVPSSATADAIPAAGARIALELVGPYPMIRGSVNGQAGRFMLDVGTRVGVLLNSNRLKLGPAARIGQGFAGSGQPVDLHLHDNVERLETWPGAAFENVDWAHSANFGFIEEGIAEDFLGFVGTDLLLPYEFTLDYAVCSVFFAGLAADGTPLVNAYDENDVVATLRFYTPNAGAPYEPILPVVDFTLGRFTIPVSFDTGNPGGKLVLTQKVRDEIQAAGLLIPDGDRFAVMDFRYGEKVIPIDGIEVEIGDAEHGALGYAFFRRFKTAWNYRTSTLKLFAQHA